MKSLRFMLPVVLMSLTTVAFAQSDAQKSDAQKSVNKPAQSDAEKSFTQLKTLAGTWQGRFAVDPPQADMDTSKPTQITMRVTSRGNALVHEMAEVGTQDDPTATTIPSPCSTWTRAACC